MFLSLTLLVQKITVMISRFLNYSNYGVFYTKQISEKSPFCLQAKSFAICSVLVLSSFFCYNNDVY